MAAAVDPGRAIQWAREPSHTRALIDRLEQLPPERALALLASVVGKPNEVKAQRATDLTELSAALFLDGGDEAKRGRHERSVHTRLLKIAGDHRRGVDELGREPSAAEREAKLDQLRASEPWWDALDAIFAHEPPDSDEESDDEEEAEITDSDAMSGVEYAHGPSHSGPFQPLSSSNEVQESLSSCPKCGARLSPNAPEAEAHLALCFPGSNRPPEESSCPVCESDLAGLNDAQREKHVEDCCKRGTGGAQAGVVGARDFAVFTCDKASQPRDTTECGVCYDEFGAGEKLVRLSCYCVYHEHCARKWWETAEGRFCPLHRAINEGANAMAIS